jgi:hypothetical protein
MSPLEDLTNYLRANEFLRSQVGLSEGRAYASYEGYVLAHGRAYTEFVEEVDMMQPKACFNNCLWMAVGEPEKYRYVEGWATSVIPVHHAWLIDEHDRVVDPTWGHRDGCAYYGVVFTVEELFESAEVQDERKVFSMLYPSRPDHPLLCSAE